MSYTGLRRNFIIIHKYVSTLINQLQDNKNIVYLLSIFYIHPLNPIFTLNNLANKMKRSGTADLPLHYGKVPPWLYERMSSLGFSIIEAILIDYGKEEVLRRLADPFWFQSFGAVMGMDWHSSGITTSVMGAL